MSRFPEALILAALLAVPAQAGDFGLETRVVDNDNLRVAGNCKIELECCHPYGECGGEAGQCVFRHQATSTPVALKIETIGHAGQSEPSHCETELDKS